MVDNVDNESDGISLVSDDEDEYGKYDGVQSQNLGCVDVQFSQHAGRLGLQNLGNTCFMNAGLQCLSHIEPFAVYFLSGRYQEEINKTNKMGCNGELAEAIAGILRHLWQDEGVCRPEDCRMEMAKFSPHLFDYEQQDIQEFFAFCLDGLHEDLNRVLERPPPLTEAEQKRDEEKAIKHGDEFAAAQAWQRYLDQGKSFLIDLLQGQLRSKVTCAQCGHCSGRFEPFLYLSVPVCRDMTRLTDAIGKFVEEELLTGDERWMCEKCKELVDAKKKIDIWMLPPVLIVHLKRFEYCPSLGDFVKIQIPLHAEEDRLDLTPYCSSAQRDGATYEVVCVANHAGKFGSGHYTATCRVGEQWLHFDDEHVRPFNGLVVNPQAYVIFLSKKSQFDSFRGVHHAPLLKRQTVSNPQNWPHQLDMTAMKSLARPRSTCSGKSADSSPNSGAYRFVLPTASLMKSSARRLTQRMSRDTSCWSALFPCCCSED